MMPLRRHQLAHLSADGWASVLAGDWDEEARACLEHWTRRRLPLVVTRQVEPGAGLSLGLPAPSTWRRRRLLLQVPRRSVVCFGEFPRALEIQALLPHRMRAAWRAFTAQLAACQAPARVYGSFGWQHLSGLPYLRAGSDIDLWVAVDGDRHADAVAACLLRFAPTRPRLDGELVFGDGSAVHWREWQAWRAGTSRQVLVKRVDGAVMASRPFLQDRVCATALTA